MEEENRSKFLIWLIRKKRLLIGICTLILIIFMVLIVDFINLIQKIINIGFLGLILFVLIYTIGFLIRAYKLKLIIKGLNINIKFSTAYFSTGAGLIVNDLVPGKIGDIVRIFIIKDQEDLRLSESVTAIAIERILDFILVFILSCFALLFLYISSSNETTLLYSIQFFLLLGVVLIVGIFLALMLLFYKTESIISIIDRILPRIADYLNRFVRNFKKGINNFSEHKKIFVLTIVMGIPTWIVDGIIVNLFFYALGYQVNMIVIIFATILINLSKSFPITPGGWGISENIGALFVIFFYPYIFFTDILSIFIIDHILRTAYLLIFGGYSLFHYNVSLKEIEINQKL